MYKFVIGKRSKNDFKDDVRSFLGGFVKLGFLLFKNKLNSDIDNIALKNLYEMN